MVRKILGRMRRALRAPIVPLRRAAHPLRATLPTLTASGRTLGRALRAPTRRRLRVGVDIRSFYEPLTGVGWYLHHLLEELARREDIELVLFGETLTTDDGPWLHVAIPGDLPVVTVDLRGAAGTRLSRPIAAAAYQLAAAAHRCDLFFAPNYFLPRVLSGVARRRVVTVHDLTFKRFPQLLQKETLENLEREIARELYRADAVICVSEATRKDLVEFFNLDPRKAFTVLSGLAPVGAFGEPTRPLPRRYLLFVSTIEPRKNLGTLLDAFDSLRDSGRYEGDLVIVGKVGWKSEDVVARIRSGRWARAIHHLDYVGREELGAIYACAELFVFPSLYEGFGFPLLEAMAHGVPTLAARSSSLPEIGGDAALYFDPQDAGALADAVARITSDDGMRRELSERGRARAASFRWSRAADETLRVFRSVVEGGR